MKILVLAGGSDQVALIQELQKRGNEVILIDYLKNPPAKYIVNKHIQESTLDIVKVKEWAFKEKVDMICTACTDQALLTVAKVSEELNLPCYLSYNSALSVTNKQYMKSRMIEDGIPTSKYISISDICNIDRIKELSYPLVIKPADCNSSKGVIKVSNKNECQEAVEEALKLSRTSTAIIEEFKEGEEISADFYVDKKKPILLSATKSTKIKGRKGFTITGSEYPAISEEQTIQLIDIANRIAKSFNLHNTPLLIQLILSNGNFYVIEFSARMGGGSKYRLIQEISDVDIMSKYVDLILGKEPNVDPIANKKVIRMIYIYTYPGILTEIIGIDTLKALGIIEESFIYKTIGSKICKADTSSDRALGLLVTAIDEQEMHDKINNINHYLSILNEKGEDIMMHSLLNEE